MSYSVVVALAFKVLVDTAILVHDRERLVLVIGGLLSLFVVTALVDVGQDRLLASTLARVLTELRLTMFAQVQRMSAAFYGAVTGGALATHFSSDLASVELGLGKALPRLAGAALRVLMSIVVMLVLDWRLALVTFALFPLGVIGPRLLSRHATRASALRKEVEGQVLTALQEQIAAQAVIKAFRLQGATLAAIRSTLERLEAQSADADFVARLVGRTTEIGQTLMQVLFIVTGATLAFHGYMSVGSLVAFFGVLLGMGNALQALSEVLPELIQAVAALDRVERFLERVPETADAADAQQLASCAGAIRFADVAFRYDGARPIVDQLSFDIPAGHSVAFVGRSGSGKSTILSLIMRFHDPTSGSVMIDGEDLRRLSQDSLRSHIGAVFQEPMLLNTTIRENIRMGRLDATDAEVEAAARAAEVHESILGLPLRYETVVGERGSQLSGGQRQRIALARAIVGNPRVLVLDEATSALDPEAEAAINDTLERLRKTHTLVSATHRLASVQRFDRIFVLDQGRVVEQGGHEELVRRDGLYARLSGQQSGFTISDDGTAATVTVDRLRRMPVFDVLDRERLEMLAGRLTSERLGPNEQVFDQGDPGDKFYILVRGSVEVLLHDRTSGDQTLAFLQDGEFFGETALLEGVPRTARVVTRAPTTFLTLAREQFLDLMQSMPALREALEQVSDARREATRARVGAG